MTEFETAELLPDDAELWRSVCRENAKAFEVVVRRHQSAVCAVAYSVCGDRSFSEDVAQEAFWAAWQQREALADPTRLRAWLCGISRNLARKALRKKPARSDGMFDETSRESPPDDQAATQEEETLVWQSLEAIPETYREPLVLFYRENQSIAEVATALDLSPDAVKQRLSRGRTMLREQVAHLVEGTLRRTRPGVTLTVAVMAGLSTSQAAWAGGVPVAGGLMAKAAGAGSFGAVAGPLLGGAGGLFGAWLGTWLPAQMAPTRREREVLQKFGRRSTRAAARYVLALLAINLCWVFVRTGPPWLWILLIAANLGITAWYVVWIISASIRMSALVQQLRAESVANDEPESDSTATRQAVMAMASRWRGRGFRSRWTFLGLPLIEFNVSDPATGLQMNVPTPRRAVGWIAIGDEARGILLAVGGTAVGTVAIGGRAMGLLAAGGIAVGGVAAGGLALGGLAVGGLGLGGLAIGGGAIGWQAIGGGAVAWDVAVGGAAIAHHAAFGGAAFATEIAVGGGASALHANDAVAKAFFETHPLKQAMDWYIGHTALANAVIIGMSILPGLIIWPLLYRRTEASDDNASQLVA